ncbi:MAG: hypothetical protein J5824_06870, partial [Lachnospiraceae bacterium]|nr:hypothetical protein [Lachnospiraceae bacterium]
MKRKSLFFTVFMLMLLISLCMGNIMSVSAEEVAPAPAAASKVTIGKTDYESLFLRVYPNGNSIIYLSTDKGTTWTEIEGKSNTEDDGKEYIDM